MTATTPGNAATWIEHRVADLERSLQLDPGPHRFHALDVLTHALERTGGGEALASWRLALYGGTLTPLARAALRELLSDLVVTTRRDGPARAASLCDCLATLAERVPDDAVRG